MPTWRITWRLDRAHRRLLVDVDADELDIENRGTHLVLTRWQMIGLNVQRVIVWRLLADEATVESLCSGHQQDDQQHDYRRTHGNADSEDDAPG
jgi:hypothetical protein